MKQKLLAATKPAQIKGVYDLLVPREVQAKYCGKGKGKNNREAVPIEIYSAMKGVCVSFFSSSFSYDDTFFFFFPDFFSSMWGADYSVMITEAINDKACQARSDISKKNKKASTPENIT